MCVVLFDMDGVLFDTEGIYKKRFKEFLEYKGYRVDDSILNLFVKSAFSIPSTKSYGI